MHGAVCCCRLQLMLTADCLTAVLVEKFVHFLVCFHVEEAICEESLLVDLRNLLLFLRCQLDDPHPASFCTTEANAV